MAHFHIPKPLHGWREFVGEVGIIVLGVLIALGFEQMVEQWQWHREVNTTRGQLANELALSATQAAMRLATEECLRDRVHELATRLTATHDQWTADPLPTGPGSRPTPHWDDRGMGRVYSVPLRGWSQDAWDKAKSGGVVDHMSPEEVAEFSAIYTGIEGIHDFQGQELQLESKLAFLSVDQRLDDNARSDALRTLGQLDALNATITGVSSLILDGVRELHLQVDRAAWAEELKQQVQSERISLGSCVKDVRVQF